MATNPLFNGDSLRFDDPETQKIADECHKLAARILGDWAEMKIATIYSEKQSRNKDA